MAGPDAPMTVLEALVAPICRARRCRAIRSRVRCWRNLWEPQADDRRLNKSQPLGHTAVMRTRAASALTEAVTSITALCGRTLGRCRAILRTLDCLPVAVDVGAVIRTFRLSLVLLLRGRLSGRRGWSMGGQRSEEHCCERYDGNESAREKHSLPPDTQICPSPRSPK
jgi:hypothetical protein